MVGLSYKHMLISTALEYLEKIISVHHSTSIWKQHGPPHRTQNSYPH